MAWTELRTWTDEEIVTEAMLNAQLRDNLTILKTSRNDLGRLSMLSAATLANLSGASLIGIAKAAAANSFVAGRTRLNQGTAARFVFPVGADKWTGTKGVDAAGVWVEGDYLHHIASDHTTEYRYLGTYVSHPAGAKVGSGWVEAGDLHYIDADGDERAVEFKGTTAYHTDVNACGGSVWVETYLHFIYETGTYERIGHADISHGDHNDYEDHNDHADVTVIHVDVAGHTDIDPHSDHTDYTDHTDYAHVDILVPHLDAPAHTDNWPHQDVRGSHVNYTDHDDITPHTNILADQRPVVV